VSSGGRAELEKARFYLVGLRSSKNSPPSERSEHAAVLTGPALRRKNRLSDLPASIESIPARVPAPPLEQNPPKRGNPLPSLRALSNLGALEKASTAIGRAWGRTEWPRAHNSRWPRPTRRCRLQAARFERRRLAPGKPSSPARICPPPA